MDCFIDSVDDFDFCGVERLVRYFVCERRGATGCAGEGRVGYCDVAVFTPHRQGGVGYMPCSAEEGEGRWGDGGGAGRSGRGCGEEGRMAEGDRVGEVVAGGVLRVGGHDRVCG